MGECCHLSATSHGETGYGELLDEFPLALSSIEHTP